MNRSTSPSPASETFRTHWARRMGSVSTRSVGIFTSITALLLPSLAWAAQPAKENVPGGALMLGAYILIWGIPLFFLWNSHRRLNSLESDLQALRSMLDNIPPDEGDATPDPAGEPA